MVVLREKKRPGHHEVQGGARSTAVERCRPTQERGTRETARDTHNLAEERRTQRSTENAEGEGETHKVERPGSPGEKAKTPRSTSQQERPGQNEDQAEKTEGPEGGEDTGTNERVVPGGGETPQDGRTTGGKQEGLVQTESSRAPVQTGRSQTKTKNKKFVLSRVTKQERRFHGCLPTVVSSFSEHKPKMQLRSSK